MRMKLTSGILTKGSVTLKTRTEELRLLEGTCSGSHQDLLRIPVTCLTISTNTTIKPVLNYLRDLKNCGLVRQVISSQVNCSENDTFWGLY